MFSIARYDPNFINDDDPHQGISGQPLADLIQFRACKTISHEICHMFGIRHCIFFECIMNGSNKMGECDIKPMRMCHVCLRKLRYMCQFGYRERYQQIRACFQDQFSENPFFAPHQQFVDEFLAQLDRPETEPEIESLDAQEPEDAEMSKASIIDRRIRTQKTSVPSEPPDDDLEEIYSPELRSLQEPLEDLGGLSPKITRKKKSFAAKFCSCACKCLPW